MKDTSVPNDEKSSNDLSFAELVEQALPIIIFADNIRRYLKSRGHKVPSTLSSESLAKSKLFPMVK